MQANVRSSVTRIVLTMVIALAASQWAAAQSPLGEDFASNDASTRTTRTAPAAIDHDHPLYPMIKFAREEREYLSQTVRDFTCRLVKRERMEGFLTENQYVDMSVREEVREGDQVVSPLSIYLYFVGPTKVAGRRVIYIEGENDGKMAVRNGGKRFDYVVTNVDPYGDLATHESLVPITQSGFSQVLKQMIIVLERHAEADPNGNNSKVERIVGAKINHRPCNVIRVTHPRKQKGLEFHVANVYVDDELRVPVRVDFSGWPRREGQPAPLLAEYTYTDLKLNVNLPDSTFTRSRLRGR